MDRFVEFFLSKWGQPTQRVNADEAILSTLAARVPPVLIEYWRELGFSVFEQGLLTLCNPIDWQPVVDQWISGTELEDLDQFIPLARGPLGNLKLFGCRYGCSVSLLPVDGAFVGNRDRDEHARDSAVKSLFTIGLNKHDLREEQFTFPQAVKKLGPLTPNEIYGFVPMLPMGGTRDLAHLQKVDAFAHLSILRQVTGELRGIMEYGDLLR